MRGWLDARLDAALADALSPPGRSSGDFLEPAGEPASFGPDSVSWRVYANPVSVFVGGVAAVVLELAEPRVRAGVWDHTRFRDEPYRRLQRTGLAAMMNVYGPRSRAESLIASINVRHAQVHGTTAAGEAYSAADPVLLRWVHATAAYGFLRAHEAFVQPLSAAERDRYYAEAAPTASLYGAVGAPKSDAGIAALFAEMAPRLEPSPVIDDFLRITRSMPAMPAWLRPLQSIMVGAAVDLLPPWVARTLRLEGDPRMATWRRLLVRACATRVAQAVLPSQPRAQAERRLGLPALQTVATGIDAS